MMGFWTQLKWEFGKGNSPVRKLIFLNTGVFVLVLLLGFVAHLFESNPGPWLRFLELSSSFKEVWTSPWTLFSYQFLHAGFWHLLFNMLFLFFLGRIFEDFQSNKRFYTVYFGGGVAGGLLFLFSFNLFPVFRSMAQPVYLLGASGAVTAIVVATAALVPNYEVFLYGIFRIRLKWLALIIVVSDIAFFPGGNQGGHLAHLGGAVFGFAYVRYTQGRLFDFGSLIGLVRGRFRPRYRVIDEKDILKTRTSGAGVKAQGKPRRSRPEQDEIDSILDKINQSGYASLTKEEKEILFKASE